MTPILKDTADIRARILHVWRQVEEKKISAAEARLHIGLARTILETLKVEIAAAHLTQTQIPPISIGFRAAAPRSSQ
jgi:ketopantoate hydroxymethyltransferase